MRCGSAAGARACDGWAGAKVALAMDANGRSGRDVGKETVRCGMGGRGLVGDFEPGADAMDAMESEDELEDDSGDGERGAWRDAATFCSLSGATAAIVCGRTGGGRLGH